MEKTTSEQAGTAQRSCRSPRAFAVSLICEVKARQMPTARTMHTTELYGVFQCVNRARPSRISNGKGARCSLNWFHRSWKAKSPRYILSSIGTKSHSSKYGTRSEERRVGKECRS